MGEETTEPRAWLVRGSKNHALDRWTLEEGYTGVDFFEVGDLTSANEPPAMREVLREEMPDRSAKSIVSYVAQLNAFVNRIELGDLVVLPVRGTGRLAFGVVTSGYESRSRRASRQRARSSTMPAADPTARSTSRVVTSPQIVQDARHRLKFVRESEGHRRKVLGELAGLDVRATVFQATGLDDRSARAWCLEQVVYFAESVGAGRIVIETDDSIVQTDKRTLFEALGKRDLREQLRYEHRRAASEPLLWVPDAVAWSYGRGGLWGPLVAPLIDRVVRNDA